GPRLFAHAGRDPLSEFPLDQRIWHMREEAEIDARRRPGQILPTLARMFQPFKAEIEDIGEVVDVVPGDAVARLSRAHGFEQGDAWLGADVVLRRLPESAGACLADRPVGLARVIEGKPLKNAGEARP